MTFQNVTGALIQRLLLVVLALKLRKVCAHLAQLFDQRRQLALLILDLVVDLLNEFRNLPVAHVQ